MEARQGENSGSFLSLEGRCVKLCWEVLNEATLN